MCGTSVMWQKLEIGTLKTMQEKKKYKEEAIYKIVTINDRKEEHCMVKTSKERKKVSQRKKTHQREYILLNDNDKNIFQNRHHSKKQNIVL